MVKSWFVCSFIRSKTIWYCLMLNSIYILCWISYKLSYSEFIIYTKYKVMYKHVNSVNITFLSKFFLWGLLIYKRLVEKRKCVQMSTMLPEEVKVLPNYDLEQISCLLYIKTLRTSARRIPPKCQGQVLGKDTGDRVACLFSKIHPEINKPSPRKWI